MMTKTEQVDRLLDAIGLIGDDIVAESSGVSAVFPISSKLRLNMIIMRRLLAAALCLVLISALTPLSVYVFNNYIAPAFMPAETTEQTDPPETVGEDDNQDPLEVPEGYSVTNSVGFEMLTSSADGSTKTMAKVKAALLSSVENGVPAIFVELRTYDGKSVTDTLLARGRGMVFLSKDASELFIFNTEITDTLNLEGYAQIVKYTVIDGKFYESTEFLRKITYFKFSTAADLEKSRVDAYNMFVDFSEELDRQAGARIILDTYTTDAPILYSPSENVTAPNITEDRKNGKTIWTIDHIAKVNGYVKPEEPLPETAKTYETEDGWLISGLTPEPGLYKVVGCTDKIGNTATVPTKFNGYDVIILDHGALQNCRAETLIIPAGIEEVYLQLWGDSIKTLIIESDDRTMFVNQCFMGYPLEEVIFTGNKTVIDREMFYQCSNLKKVTLPSTVKTISRMAFQSCTSLETIDLPEGLQTIEKSAFYYCTALKKISLPTSLEKVDEGAFALCSSLEEIEILANIDTLVRNLFWNHNCTELVIPEGVTFIDDNSIQGNNMKTLHLPSTLNNIVTYFIDLPTSAIDSIYYNGTVEQWNAIPKSGLYGSEYNEYTVYCTDGEINMYPGGLPMN